MSMFLFRLSCSWDLGQIKITSIIILRVLETIKIAWIKIVWTRKFPIIITKTTLASHSKKIIAGMKLWIVN